MSRVIHVNEADFEATVLKAGVPVVVDFWAPWCGPCKMMEPVIDAAAVEREGVIFAKLNVDENKALAEKYGVRGIPTCLVFRDGLVQATKVGAVTRSQMSVFLDLAVNKPISG
jgi:thioredoxin 1